MIARATGQLLAAAGSRPATHRGTAFAISRTHALTAAHCVGDRQRRVLDGDRLHIALRDATRTVEVERFDFDVDAALLRVCDGGVFSHHLDVLRHPPRCLTWSAHAHPVAHEVGLRLSGHVSDLDGRVGAEPALQLLCDEGGLGSLEGSSGAAVCTGDWAFGIVRCGPPDLQQRVIFASPMTEVIARLGLGDVLPPAPPVLDVDGPGRGNGGTALADAPPWLAALARLVDLDATLTAAEIRALRDHGAGGRGHLLDALRDIAQRLVRDRRQPAIDRSAIDAVLAACTARIDTSRGVIRPVIASHDRTTAEICQRAVGLDLAAALERHRAVLADGSIAVVRAASLIELDPAAQLEPANLAALAAHAGAMTAEIAALQRDHLGDAPDIAAVDLIPVPGATVAGAVVVPLATPEACHLRITPRGADAITVPYPRGHAPHVVVRFSDDTAGDVDWEVVTRDALGRPWREAAGWVRIAAGAVDLAADASRADRCLALTRAGAWNEVVLDLWPRIDDGDITAEELEVLRQILRNAHEWIQRAAPRWRRLETYGHAITAVEHRLRAIEGGRDA